ncbi:bZIP transcription factor 12-like [Lolium rigidum]|uniref:bZIP transcription factor 12-like n=1 Tax=Lolium rigidum TaxID=89674 RepID=UPI001F5D9E2D|nr:bZIP transcription factor 12-like [Lolium rigidum]
MASSKVSSSSPAHTASDLARFAAAAGRPGGGSGMGSMNVEELLRGIYGDIPATPAPDRPTSPVPAPAPRHEPAGAAPRTAVEVWKEITGGSSGGEEVVAGAAEMTLEDFLARESDQRKLDAVGMPMPGPSAALEEQVALTFQLNGPEAARGGGRGKKRQLMDPMDRAAMQRQKRMIKNRESAARSRERKQAYIAELESLVTQLEQENANLSKEQEEATQKRLKELKEKVTPVIISKTPPQDLRRTNSMEW